MRSLLPVVAVTAALVLAGCSEPEPGSPLPTGGAKATRSAPTETTSAAPSVSASPTSDATEMSTPKPSAVPTEAPTLPPEATTNDAAGAEAFVKYWYEVANYSVISGDAEALRELTDASCRTCASIIESIDKQYASGGSFVEGRSTPADVTSPQPQAGYVIVALSLSQTPPIALDADGVAVNPDEADRPTVYLQMSMEHEGGSWRVLEIAQ